jgi:(p)ppGpp synthase/HD superfamily hydrolase
MENKNNKNNDIISKALQFSYKAHKGTFRKGTKIPYIVHPLDVASILMKNNAPEHVIIAGLLHDVVEDEDYEDSR